MIRVRSKHVVVLLATFGLLTGKFLSISESSLADTVITCQYGDVVDLRDATDCRIRRANRCVSPSADGQEANVTQDQNEGTSINVTIRGLFNIRLREMSLEMKTHFNKLPQTVEHPSSVDTDRNVNRVLSSAIFGLAIQEVFCSVFWRLSAGAFC
jgi:hypothetical protein